MIQAMSLYRLKLCCNLMTHTVGTINVLREFVRFDIVARKINFLYVGFCECTEIHLVQSNFQLTSFHCINYHDTDNLLDSLGNLLGV